MKFTFVVNVTSVNGLINVDKTFTITVVRAFNEPYENLYIQAMPPQNDRDLVNSLLHGGGEGLLSGGVLFPKLLISFLSNLSGLSRERIVIESLL
jgi:hypothetical protein